MAKKKNKAKTVQDSATLSRISFLHQAAHVVPLQLQRHYLTTSKVAMKKTMLKLYLLLDLTDNSDPKLKRLTCRRCAALLSPQTGNVSTRLAESTGKGTDMLEIECRHCHTTRRFSMTEGYTLHSDKEPVDVVQIH